MMVLRMIRRVVVMKRRDERKEREAGKRGKRERFKINCEHYNADVCNLTKGKENFSTSPS